MPTKTPQRIFTRGKRSKKKGINTPNVPVPNRRMNYGRPLFDLVRKSLDFPKGKLIAFNIEAREARTLIRRFAKREHGSMVYFELIPSTVQRIYHASDYFTLHSDN